MARGRNRLAVELQRFPLAARAVDPAWHEVMTGDDVLVTLPGGHELRGTLDARTADSSVVWILVEGDGRRMLHPGDGLAVDKLPREP